MEDISYRITSAGKPGAYLDFFIVMNSGEAAYKNAGLSRIPNDFSVYHYYPPTFKFSGDVRNEPPLHTVVKGLGGMKEPDFTKRGPAIVLDDVFCTGNTLNFTFDYLAKLGYSIEDIFAYVQKVAVVDGKDVLYDYMTYRADDVMKDFSIPDDMLDRMHKFDRKLAGNDWLPKCVKSE